MKRNRFHKYPLVRQYDQLDCGPAALLSVLRYYGGDTSLVRMRQLCRTEVHGSTMLDLLHAAEAIGFNAQGATGSLEDLAKEEMPGIAHVVLPDGLQHFLVVYKIKKNSLFIGDPGKGKYHLTR